MWKGLSAVPVPYHRALKAIAFAGKSVSSVREILGRLNLEFPQGEDSFLRGINMGFMTDARAISPDYKFTDEQCIELEIDAFYQYIVACGRRGVNEKADFVCKVLIDCRDVRLRKMIDTLLFIGEYDPGVIRERIYTNAISPSTRWGEEEIGFYRDFLWDTSIMTNADWLKYRSWFENGIPKLAHIDKFNASASQGELLHYAELSLGICDSSMLEQARDMLYYLLKEANMQKDPVTLTRLSDAINKNISLASKDLGDSTGRKKIQMAIERISTPLDGSIGKVAIKTRDDLPEGSEISDRSKIDQLESVLNGDYDPEPIEETGVSDDNVIHT